jgi:hypothetical protein
MVLRVSFRTNIGIHIGLPPGRMKYAQAIIAAGLVLQEPLWSQEQIAAPYRKQQHSMST